MDGWLSNRSWTSYARHLFSYLAVYIVFTSPLAVSVGVLEARYAGWYAPTANSVSREPSMLLWLIFADPWIMYCIAESIFEQYETYDLWRSADQCLLLWEQWRGVISAIRNKTSCLLMKETLVLFEASVPRSCNKSIYHLLCQCYHWWLMKCSDYLFVIPYTVQGHA